MRYVPPAERRRAPDRSKVAEQVPTANNVTNIGTRVVSYLISGPVAYGAIGYGLDRWLGTEFLLPVGVLLGFFLSLYIVWVRYGGSQATGQGTDATKPAVATGADGAGSAPAANQLTITEEIS